MDGNGRGPSAWAEAGAAFDRMMAAAQAGDASDPAAILNQAALIGFASLLRSWAEFAAICAGGSDLAPALASPEASEAERREMAEHVRKLLREVGDLASREARRLQSDLAALALRLADPAPAAAPRRYARAKP